MLKLGSLSSWLRQLSSGTDEHRSVEVGGVDRRLGSLGKPCNPSTPAITISAQPRLRVIEDFQPAFGPCCLLTPKPQHSLASTGSNPQRKNTRPYFSRALHPESEAAAHRDTMGYIASSGRIC